MCWKEESRYTYKITYLKIQSRAFKFRLLPLNLFKERLILVVLYLLNQVNNKSSFLKINLKDKNDMKYDILWIVNTMEIIYTSICSTLFDEISYKY